MKKIIVPTDFSPNADKALDLAVQIAKQAKAEVVLLHVCNDLIYTTFKDRQTMYREYNQTMIDKANGQLLSLKRSIEDNEKFSINIKLYKGPVTDTILHASEKHQADLIIMGSQGKAGLVEKIFGGKTAWIIGKTRVPIMSVPILSKCLIPQNILLPVNDINEQPDIINPVFEIAGLFSATIHIVMFTDVDSAEAIDYLLHKKNITAFEEKLKTQYKNIKIKSVHLSGYKFEEIIEQYIGEQHIDIVAMVTHKRTFLESIFNRSMTKKMSYQTRIPMLAIPAQTNH